MAEIPDELSDEALQSIDQLPRPILDRGMTRRGMLGLLVGGAATVMLAPRDAFAAAPKLDTKALTDKLLHEPKLRPPEGKFNTERIDVWKKRYLGLDPYYGRNLPNGGTQSFKKGLIDGWNRLTASGHLQLVHQICAKHNVPFDMVFLAIGESHWSGTAKSRVGAKGYWQIMPATARRDLGMTVNMIRDDRTDPEKSTEAAIKYLRRLYQLTYRWDTDYDLNSHAISENDRWMYAAFAYNRGMGNVEDDYHRFKGRSAPYAKAMFRRVNESAEYVNKMFGIRAAFAHMYAHGGLTHVPMPAPQKDVVPAKKLPADLAFERYIHQASQLHATAKLQALRKIYDLYENADQLRDISVAYVTAQMDLVSGMMTDIRIENASTLRKKYGDRDTQVAIDVDQKTGEETLDVAVHFRADYNGEKVRASIVEYEVQPGDRLHDIAIRLCGDRNKVGLVKRVIADLNSDIEDLDVIYRKQIINVPGSYITVPRGAKMKDLLRKYYPDVPSRDAIFYLKFLNGKNHADGDIIKVGEVILVPAIR